MKLNSGARSIFYNVTFLGLALVLQACGGGGGGTPNAAPVASAVSITDDNAGTIVVGDSLTATYTYTDAESNAESTTTFKWLRDGVAISGATASTYSLIVADSGKSITLSVTPIASAGTATGTAAVSAGVTVVNSAPTVSSASITDNNGGTAVYKDTLTAAYSFNDVDGDAEGTSTFIWLRNGTAISGATASTYTLAATDTEQSITLSVTAIAASGITTGNLNTSTGITVDALPDQDGSGIYNGTANIDSGNTDITDLRGIIYNSRFLLFSETASTHVLYDGTITAITKNNYTATVNVYESGVKTQTNVAVTGNVLTAETITGTMGTPGNAGNHNGTFSLTFNSKYNYGASTTKIESTGFNKAVGTTYGTLDLSGSHTFQTDLVFSVFSSGASSCTIIDVYSIPDATVNIYEFNNITIRVDASCLDSYEGTGYSGLFSLVDDAIDGVDSRILVAYTNGTNSVFGFLTKP